MISFIIIGRNEGQKLDRCLHSVFRTIDQNSLKKYEVIYVDSNSSDSSLKIAKKYKSVKIIKLTRLYNAAIARNIGSYEAIGNTLFFIDGDMEILPEFLTKVYSIEEGLIYNFISGQLKNYNYNQEGEFINNSWQYRQILNGDKYLSTSGGIFLISNDLWNLVSGMDIRFKRGQDLDLALRLAKKGYPILRKKEIIANHHTVAYTHHSRMWKMLFSGDVSFSNAFIIRKHIFNKHLYLGMIKANYTLLSLIFFLFLSILSKNYFFMFGYFLSICLKLLKQKGKSITKRFELLAFYPIRDLLMILYLFIPMKRIKKNDIQYTIIS